MSEAEPSPVDRPDRILQNFIAGEWTDIDPIGEVVVTNPATGGGIGVHPMSSPAAIDSAVQAAAAAFTDWRKTPVPTRAALMFRYRHLLHEARDELAAIRGMLDSIPEEVRASMANTLENQQDGSWGF